jgi:transposase
MKKIREVMRLKWECGCSHRAIGKSIKVSDSTVSDCLRRARDAGLSWPLPDDLTDDQLEKKLYSPIRHRIGEEKRGKIDWPYIHKELKRKHVTLRVLWFEYREKYPQGIGYSRFCDVYREWRQPLAVWMHQDHKAGEKLFVDYAGQTMPIVINNSTGEVGDAQIFVAALGASSFTFIEATWTQSLPDWIQSHINAFEFFGGCAEILVPDNLLSGIRKTHLYEPDINQTYQEMATHYGAVVIPARVNSPKDKSKVENAVQQTERQVLARLRNRTFFSIEELNQALRFLQDDLNKRPFQKLQGSRLSQFEELDKPALKPLPSTRYEYAEWKKAKAGFNYHVEINKHHYSVPYTFIKKELQVRYNSKTVEIFYQNERIASHVRSYVAHGYTTNQLHMPKNHQYQAEWTPERITSWAEKIGPETAHLIEAIMISRSHPQQGFRSCVGVLRLAKPYGNERLEAACKRALSIGTHNYKSVESILKHNLEKQPLPTDSILTHKNKTPNSHEYVRGQSYFQ